MRLYEIAVVLHPDLEIDLDSASAKIEKIIEAAKGKIVKKDNWGKRKLAYKINKQDWGIYIFYQVKLEPAAVAKIDNTLRITEEVMRYLVVSLDHIRYIRKGGDNEKTTQKTADETVKTDDENKTAEKSKKKGEASRLSKEEVKEGDTK